MVALDKTRSKRKTESGISYIEVIISLGILSIFTVSILAVILHIYNITNLSYKKSISYHASSSIMTAVANTLREMEDLSQINSHNIFTLTGFSEEEFGTIFRNDILNYVINIEIKSATFTENFIIGNVAPLGFTPSFISLYEVDELQKINIYIEVKVKDMNYNVLNTIRRRLPIVF